MDQTASVALLRASHRAIHASLASSGIAATAQRRSTIRSPGRSRASGPLLLVVVIGAFLLIVGTTASGLAGAVNADASSRLLDASVSADAATVRSFVGLNLLASDLAPGGLAADRAAAVEQGLRLLIDRGGILDVALLTPDGSVLVSANGGNAGRPAPQTPGLANASANQQADAAIVRSEAAGALAPLAAGTVLSEYLPVVEDGRVTMIAAVWRDATPILAQLEEARTHTLVVALAAALICAALLALIFGGAQRRMSRETRERLEAARHDPLTGSLDRGALDELLVRQVDAARGTGASIGVALLELDPLGATGAASGQQAADLVLVDVARVLADQVPAGMTWGRYGPQEFLVIAADPVGAELEPALERVRASLAERTPRLDGSERRPVTFSAGVCSYPSNGESVTALLAMMSQTLDEAKASGGDAVRIAEPGRLAPGYLKAFAVLEGLVTAIDAKDRHTLRHSEDVARYADFLGLQLELDGFTRQALHRAALLHDVGKIGVPDAILRKLDRFTDDDFDVVRQHVRLGESIVRDLPDADLIREGIRHHHEWWNGAGYMTGLAAGEIPLIARILAIADAYSAMTLPRPYRKPVSVAEALRELEAVAGSQLDPHLVDVFVRAVRNSAYAPMPLDATPDGTIEALALPGRTVG